MVKKYDNCQLGENQMEIFDTFMLTPKTAHNRVKTVEKYDKHFVGHFK